jgi:hypothetical protein
MLLQNTGLDNLTSVVLNISFGFGQDLSDSSLFELWNFRFQFNCIGLAGQASEFPVLRKRKTLAEIHNQ